MSEHKDQQCERLIGQSIRRARLKNGMTQKALGEHFDISLQQIQKYENGKNRLSASRLLGMSLLFNEPVDVFLDEARAGLTGEKVASEKVETNQAEEARKLANLICSIADPHVKKGLTAFIKRYHQLAGEGAKAKS